MPVQAIICDWNGTIIGHRNERPILEHIAVSIFRACFPLRVTRMVRILRARRRLRELHIGERVDDDFDFVREMFAVYNRIIISGVPVSWIDRAVEDYADKAETQAQLDRRVLCVVRDCHQAGTITGILSAGYGRGIEAILSAAGYIGFFDFVAGDGLDESRGKALGFRLDIYRHKHEYLAALLQEHGLDAQHVVYIGDSDDDEGCFDLVGHPVVAFLADEHLRTRCVRRYGAFAPADERELSAYLRNA